MKATWILAKLTFLEAIRRKILVAGLVLGVAFLLIYSIGLHYILEQIGISARQLTSSAGIAHVAEAESKNGFLMVGLYAVTFLSVALAALLGADTLAGEINSGTIQTIVTKPIRRANVVLGKWLGFAWLLGLYVFLVAGGVVLSMFVQGGYIPDNLLIGLSLIYFESLLVMTITLLCSSALPALATGGIVFGLYGLAFIGGWIEQFGAVMHNPTAVKIGIISSLLVPSESLWHRAVYEMQTPLSGSLGLSPFGTSSVPSLLMIAYAAAYLIFALYLAVRTFEKRDL